MSKVAVIKSGGKQYLVEEGDKVKLEKNRKKKGSITFSQILLYSDKKDTLIKPKSLNNVKVKGEVISFGKGKKIEVVKQKPKKRYYKKQGHRQSYMEVEIKKITNG